MGNLPVISAEAYKHVGVTPDDVEGVIRRPVSVEHMSDLVAQGLVEYEHERPNVVVYAGHDFSRRRLVVFVDRFKWAHGEAFHSEPGDLRFGFMYQ